MRFNRRSLFTLCVCLCTGLGWAYYSGYRWNTSVSYPSGIYRLSTTPAAFSVGDLVLFCPPDSPVLQEAVHRDYLRRGRCQGGFQPVIKRIAALAGTRVTLRGIVALDGVPVSMATVRQLDGKGRPLPQLPDFTVPFHTVFLLSDYAPSVSFDSRYYGSVPLKNILGHIVPIWTR